MALVSVIVPVYNVETYLKRCLDSILSQTFTDFELILVDDGSTDNSGKICDEYSLRDDRVRVIHQINGGVSSARNNGLSAAKGEYITFVDSDDFVKDTYLEKLLLLDCDLSIGGCCITTPDGEVVEVPRKEVDCKDNVTVENIVKWFEHGSLYSVWTSMFKTSIIRKYGLQFDTNTTRGEDTIFMFEYVKYCEKVKFVSDILYYYVRYGEKTLTTTRNLKSVKALAYLDAYLKEWFKKNNVNSKKFNSVDYWTKYEQKMYFFDTLGDKDMPLSQKYEWYKVFFKSANFTDYMDQYFCDDSSKFRRIIKFKSPLVLVLYELSIKLLKK